MSKRVLFLMSDTGGGHRAAAEAIRDALYKRYGEENISAKLVDVFREYCGSPLKNAPEIYPWMIKNTRTLWGIQYQIPNSPRRARLAARPIYWSNAGRLNRLPLEHPADVVVSVHSVITRPSLLAYQQYRRRPHFITVVTDLVSTPMLWYDRQTDRCFVPTHAAYNRGLQCGLKPGQLHITGLPVHPDFLESLYDESTPDMIRHELGWELDVPTILLVAGGDGMGTLYETAREINRKNLPCQLVIVCGTNDAVKAKLEAAEWNQSTIVYGYVRNMPILMKAADILVTKAGPATITEASIAGLPMILSDAIPGQEEGNWKYIVQNNAGVYAPKPDLVAQTVASWLDGGNAQLQTLAENARRLARPNAVWEIADAVWEYSQKPPTRYPHRRNLWHTVTGQTRKLLSTWD